MPRGQLTSVSNSPHLFSVAGETHPLPWGYIPFRETDWSQVSRNLILSKKSQRTELKRGHSCPHPSCSQSSLFTNKPFTPFPLAGIPACSVTHWAFPPSCSDIQTNVAHLEPAFPAGHRASGKINSIPHSSPSQSISGTRGLHCCFKRLILMCPCPLWLLAVSSVCSREASPMATLLTPGSAMH